MWPGRNGEVACVSIDENRCIGCGCCTDVAPELFRFDGGDHPIFLQDALVGPQRMHLLEAAVHTCPARAINVRFR